MTRRYEYIGVSGVVNQEQQAELEAMFAGAGLVDQRKLQLGVKATHKTQYLNIENKYGREWYPVGNEIRTALSGRCAADYTSGVVQVCYDSEAVYDDEYRRALLSRMLGKDVTNRWLTGLQFDMLPDWCGTRDQRLLTQEVIAGDVEFLCSNPKSRTLTITLQCQGDVMSAHSPQTITNTLATFGDKVDYILFDASGGRGVRMNPDNLLPYIEAVYESPNLIHLGVAVGGGLNATVIRTELPKVLRHFPDISWDAEGRLHPLNADGKRPLDIHVVREYFEASAEVLR